jgi:hypothetical protein
MNAIAECLPTVRYFTKLLQKGRSLMRLLKCERQENRLDGKKTKILQHNKKD